MEYIITALVSISEAPVHARWQTLHSAEFCTVLLTKKELVIQEHCAQWILWSLFHGSFHHTDIILSNFVIAFIWDHDGGQLSFCLPLFIPDSSHFFFLVLVSVIFCLSSNFAWNKTFVLFIHGLLISYLANQKWKILSIFFAPQIFLFSFFFILSSTFLCQIGMVLTTFVWKRLNIGFSILLLGLSWVNWLYSSCEACIFSAVFFGLIMTMLAFPNCSMTSTTEQFVHKPCIVL